MKNKKEKFIKFLRKHRILTKFKRNYSRYTCENKVTLDKFLNTTDCRDFVSGAFIWNETPEEHSYWYVVEGEWNKELGIV